MPLPASLRGIQVALSRPRGRLAREPYRWSIRDHDEKPWLSAKAFDHRVEAFIGKLADALPCGICILGKTVCGNAVGDLADALIASDEAVLPIPSLPRDGLHPCFHRGGEGVRLRSRWEVALKRRWADVDEHDRPDGSQCQRLHDARLVRPAARDEDPHAHGR